MKKNIAIVGIFAACMMIVGLKDSKAQAIYQVTYSSANQNTVTISSSAATQLDSAARIKYDRRMLIVQNTGSIPVWCATNTSPAYLTGGFLIINPTTTYTGSYSVPNMVSFPVTANVPIYCKAEAGAAGTVSVLQLR